MSVFEAMMMMLSFASLIVAVITFNQKK
ncbi:MULTISPECIES: putative holin-like toxin [Bacillus]